MVSGSCLCGRFAFEIEGPFENMMHCHCGYCRKHHGAAFATYVGAPTSGFRWRSGKGVVCKCVTRDALPGMRGVYCGAAW